MGKTAENERIKIKANWFNSVSIGVILGGFFVPYFGIMQRIPVLGPAEYASALTTANYVSAAIEVIAFISAVWLSLRFRKYADNLLAGLQD